MTRWLAEEAVGMCVESDRITTVRLVIPFRAYGIRFRVIRIRSHAGLSDWDHLLDDVPVTIPIIPVFLFPVLAIHDPGQSVTEMPDIYKPMRQDSGSCWIDGNGLTGADFGTARTIFDRLQSMGRRCPGGIHPGQALASLLCSSPFARDRFVVTATGHRITMIGIDGGQTVFCRAFREPLEHAGATILATYHRLTEHDPEWHPGSITWMGPRMSGETLSGESTVPIQVEWTPDSRFSMPATDTGTIDPHADTWGIAAGAVACWMQHFRPPLLVEAGTGHRPGLPVLRRSGLLAGIAVLVLLLSLTGRAGGSLLQLYARENQLAAIVHSHEGGPVSFQGQATIPGIPHLPPCLAQIRHHRYLADIAVSTAASGITLSDIDTAPDCIRIQGTCDGMDAINNFVRDFKQRLAGIDATRDRCLPRISIPVTTRNTSNRLLVTIELTWGSES
ncbi:hypothetical protein JXA80_06380 [bacterium]|nr:hypothetical protein [candidate division CSSED10-310 bacterium]